MKLLSKKTGEIHLSNLLPPLFEKFAIPSSIRFIGTDDLGDYMFQEFNFTGGFIRLSYLKSREENRLIVLEDVPHIIFQLQMLNSLTCRMYGILDLVFHEWGYNFYYSTSPYKEVLIKGTDCLTFEIFLTIEYSINICPGHKQFNDFITRATIGGSALLTRGTQIANHALLCKVNSVLYSAPDNREALIHDLLRLALHRNLFDPKKKRVRLPPLHAEKIYAVKRYIIKHLEEKHTLLELSNIAGVSPHELNRHFRAIYGTSPVAFYNTERMYMAKTLVRRNGKKMWEIAVVLGYNSESAFIRAFRKVYGKTPIEFMQKETKNLCFLYFSAHRKWPDNLE